MSEWIADWEDVLRRSGRSRFPSRRATAIAAVTAVAVVLALPGIGIGGGLNAWISDSQPGLHLHAELRLPGGRNVGTLSVRVTRIFVSLQPRQIFFGRGRHPVLPPVPVRWSLALAPGKTARSVVIEDALGKIVVRLCAPCSEGAHGTVRLHPRALLSVLRGQAVAETSAGTARGGLTLPAGIGLAEPPGR